MTIKETAFSLMGSQLLFIPVLVILIFIAIKKALSPLTALSSDIQKRHSHDLKPFSEDEMPAEMKPLVHSLNTFMHRVSDMVSVLKRFTADAAHELRTPITALRIQLNLVEQAKSTSEREQAINTLKDGIDRSEQLISQLLTLARTEPNSQSREVTSINLLSLIKECIEGLLPQAHEKLIDLGLQPSEELKVIGVRHEIKVLINNIMENAIRYTPNHGKVDIALFSNAEDIVLEIKDNGPGIPNDDFERVFERFYRGENLNVNGSGLGLSIVREIATQHYARIELLNLIPGLSFRVYFIR
jgi:two-component system, OmpR family, sensor kinase